MKSDALTQQIRVLEQYLQAWRRRASESPEQQTLLAEAMEELSAVLGRLSVTAEELRQRNDELEIRVKARDAELVESDQALHNEIAEHKRIEEELREYFEQVRATNEQLRLLARQVVSVQEQERRRVSRELHDEAGQALTALKISLELVMADLPSGAESLHERIRESVILTDDTMERIRLLARDLRPPALDAVGLSPTLEDVCRDFGERTHLSINYEGEKLPVLPDAVSICLYRVLQEALTNVAKHAQAQHVWAALRRETDSISLSVEDDGQGFDTQATLSFTGRPMGIGLLGIRDRLELLSGWLEIDSQPGKGTRLVAHVPWEETE